MLAAVGFFAAAVFGLGAVSVATNADIISVPGLGHAPGIVGMLCAIVAFTLSLAGALRREHPSFFSVPAIALTTSLVHLVAVAITVLFDTGDLILPTVVAGGLVQGGASAVMLLASAVAGWGGIALRRTRGEAPRWPWEREADE